jgi:hypothetical protein
MKILQIGPDLPEYFDYDTKKSHHMPHPTTLLVVRVSGLTTILDSVVPPYDDLADVIPPVGFVTDDESDTGWLAPPEDGYFRGQVTITYSTDYWGEHDVEVEAHDWVRVDAEDLKVNGADGTLLDIRRDNKEVEDLWPCKHCSQAQKDHEGVDLKCPTLEGTCTPGQP